MARFLPTLPERVALIDKIGAALPTFQTWWQQVVDTIESKFSVEAGSGIVISDGGLDGVVRTLDAGTGLTVTDGTGVAGNPTYSLADTAVTPDTYGAADSVAQITVDQQGRLTGAADVAILITPAAAGLGNVSNKSQLPLDGTDAMAATLGLMIYTVAALPAVAAGRIAYASNGRKNGEGAGLGTGVLVFRDATNWIACDSGATVAA